MSFHFSPQARKTRAGVPNRSQAFVLEARLRARSAEGSSAGECRSILETFGVSRTEMLIPCSHGQLALDRTYVQVRDSCLKLLCQQKLGPGNDVPAQSAAKPQISLYLTPGHRSPALS